MALAEVARLVPLHEAAAPFHQLPQQQGSMTIGRRANCTVVINDSAVSGLHCVLRCLRQDPLTFQAEDRSTNGIFINDVRVAKGICATFGHGDILSLGKVVEDYGGDPSSVRPQFRLEVHRQERSLEKLGQPLASSREMPSDNGSMDGSGGPQGLTAPTSLDNQSCKPVMASTGTSTAEGCAQDLLVQEQQSKAKITGELLLVRRRLDEERAARESLERELYKSKTVFEDEHARRTSAQDGLERLQAETEELRQQHQEFQELSAVHAALETKHETVEVELGSLLQRTTALESGRDHLRMDWQRASADEARVRSQLAEAQARLQQAQEHTENLQRRQLEARSSAEVAQESVERWQRELSNERATREQLEDQATLLHADAERALQGECVAKEALAIAEAQRSQLQFQFDSCRVEAIALRSKAKQHREKLDSDSMQADRLRGAGSCFVEALRAYSDSWTRGLTDGTQNPSSSRSVALLKTPDNAALCQGGATSFHKNVKTVVQFNIEESAVADVSGAVAGIVPSECPLAAVGKTASAADEPVRPPVPPWKPLPAAVPKEQRPGTAELATTTANVSGDLQGQVHGMASLMIASQESPLLTPLRSPEAGGLLESACDGAVQPESVDKSGLLDLDVAAVQRLASTSILSFVTPQTKRTKQLQSDSAGRKRVRIR